MAFSKAIVKNLEIGVEKLNPYVSMSFNFKSTRMILSIHSFISSTTWLKLTSSKIHFLDGFFKMTLNRWSKVLKWLELRIKSFKNVTLMSVF